jgi:MFS family permease
VSRSVWAVAALGLVVIAAVVWTSYRQDRLGDTPVTLIATLALAVTLIAFVLSGALIVSRQPGNIIGRLLMIPGLVIPSSELAFNWLLRFDLPPTSAELPVWLALWFTNWSWVLLIFPIFHLILTFPDGKLLSPRWRWVTRLEVVMIAFIVTSATFAERLPVVNDEDVTLWSVPNPIGFIPESWFGNLFGVVWSFGLVGLTAAGVVAVVRRFRAGDRELRQQLKWPLYGVALFGIVYALGIFEFSVAFWDLLFGLALAAIPISVAIAVLRFHLYEIDRIVSRTVTYAVVAILLVAVFLVVVLGLGAIVGRNNPVAVAGATLGAAALFNPARFRIRRWVDRRFNRSRYDAVRVVDDFVVTLRHRIDADEVVEGWVDVVGETMQPAAVGAWIRR